VRRIDADSSAWTASGVSCSDQALNAKVWLSSAPKQFDFRKRGARLSPARPEIALLDQGQARWVGFAQR